MMILCFGTFASILRLCKLPGVTDPQLVGTMTKTVDPNCRYISPDNATAISRLLSCTGGFSTGRSKGGSGAMKAGEGISDVVQLAKSETTDNIVGDFQIKVLELLDEDKKALAVLALMDIIRQDETLDGTRKHTFEKYLGIKKDALLAQSELLLSHFLAGLFLYTVVIGKNTDGRECVKTVSVKRILCNQLKTVPPKRRHRLYRSLGRSWVSVSRQAQDGCQQRAAEPSPIPKTDT